MHDTPVLLHPEEAMVRRMAVRFMELVDEPAVHGAHSYLLHHMYGTHARHELALGRLMAQVETGEYGNEEVDVVPVDQSW